MSTPAYLTPQTITIPLRAGVDRKTSEKSVDPPKLLQAVNCSFDSPGEIKKDRRYSTTSCATSTGQTTGPSAPWQRVLGVGKTRSVLTQSDAFDVRDSTRSTRLSAEFFAAAWGAGYLNGEGVTATTSSESISELRALVNHDYACTSDGLYELLITTTSTAVAHRTDYTIRERATRTVIYAAAIDAMPTGSIAQAVGVGAYLALVYPTATGLTMLSWNPSNASVTAATTVICTDRVTSLAFGSDASEDGLSVFVVYQHSGSAMRVRTVLLSTLAVTVGSSTSGVPSGGCLAIACGTTHYMIAWYLTAGGVRAAGYTLAHALIGATVVDAAATPTQIALCDRGDAATFAIFYDNGAFDELWRTSITYGGTAGTIRTLWKYKLAHRPFLRHGLIYFGVFNRDTTAGTSVNQYAATVVCDSTLQYCQPVAWYLMHTCGATTVGATNHVPNVATAPDDINRLEYRFAIAERFYNGAIAGFESKYAIETLRFNDGEAISMANTWGMAGGAMRDARGIIDLAFHFGPYIVSTAESNTGPGALTALAVYTYVAIFEFTDSYGNVQRSTVSAPRSLTLTGANDTATVTVRTPFTRVQTLPRIVLYRTAANLGAPYYRVAETAAGANDRRTASNYAFIDVMADSVATLNEQVYTDNGTLPNYPPPQGRFWAIHQNRVFCIDEHSHELRYSRTLVAGELPAFHPVLSIPLATDRIEAKGLYTSPAGLWILGIDKATGASAIALMIGDGPSDSGVGATYQLQRIEGSLAGIDSGAAACMTSQGIVFRDPVLGIHLQPTSGGPPTPIGLPVDALCSGKVLVRVTPMQDLNEVRFVFRDGFMAVLDLLTSQWSTRQLLNISANVFKITDSCVWDSRHVVSDLDDGVLQMTDGFTGWELGASNYLPTTISTGWFKLADFAGMVRLWEIQLVGRVDDLCALTVSVYYDYSSAAPDVYTFAQGTFGAAGDPLQLRIPIRRQTCSAFRLTIVDSVTAAGSVVTNQSGCAFSAINLRYGVYGRGQRLGPGKVAS